MKEFIKVLIRSLQMRRDLLVEAVTTGSNA
jgi:hypothetical protein